MKSALTGLVLLLVSSAAAASPPVPKTTPSTTDFGVRAPPSGTTAAPAIATPALLTEVTPVTSKISLSSAVAVASRLGRVTSTRRSASRNRAVGGAPNSFHLRGRAIDVVPRRGVRHADIEAALRRAGFNLLESLDEGDHSHFAFGTAPIARINRAAASTPRREVTPWRIVTAPRLASR